jgi:hypothetical protein
MRGVALPRVTFKDTRLESRIFELRERWGFGKFAYVGDDAPSACRAAHCRFAAPRRGALRVVAR